ncbi:magnesium transporter CorA family protein [Oscillibacter sp.]|uniref:magnesium transporter CorA family protein n=1 Tax=Oscillibacter sp. TaxID=1945593 RepID=UPI0026099E60|nr:magnesium transporter CorA family protein [Oscillibacter sp.]MDD3346152.1 magnesium transporter CorA family protein [Oscillibacter sp.]
MTHYYLTEQEQLKELPAPQSGCWVSVVAPDEGELNHLAEHYQLDMDLLRAALDTDERSRIDTDEGYTMVLVNIPTVEEQSDKELYSTIPMAILMTGDAIITVCSEESPVIQAFERGRVRDFHTQMKSRFILQFLYRIDTLYLQYLRNVDKKSEEVEAQLHKSTQNRELIELLKLEKSLVYFTTALRSNEAVLEKLLRTDLVKKYPEDAELLEDVIVENKQAIEMANIYSGILSGMMDAFASVISNNLNIVMKVLAIITIVMAIPTMIFSAYGMNVNVAGMPFSQSAWGFPIIIGVSVALSVVVTLIFSKLKMFK